MIKIYHSNRTDLLKDIVIAIMTDEPIANPFISEIILVQSTSMAQWMQIELATKFNISANINFLLPASFIWKIFNYLFPNINIKDIFSKSTMIWRFMKVLPIFCKKINSDHVIFQYLYGNNKKYKLFQLAKEMANLFDKYMIYRPDWLQIWLSNKNIKGLPKNNQFWQSLLWKFFINDIKQNGNIPSDRYDLCQKFLFLIKNNFKKLKMLPNRLFIFCISTLPPMYLQILQKIGCYIDIYIMFNNPCRYYWAEINNEIEQKYENIKQDNIVCKSLFCDNLHNEQDDYNTILASWGKVGQDYTYMLSECENAQEYGFFIKPKNNCLLNQLKIDILELKDYTTKNFFCNFLKKKINNKKRSLKLKDRSLCFHVCHSIYREVEVLYNEILTTIEDDKSVKLSDIIVMISDIDTYIPAIYAVFNNKNSNNHLPFVILNKKMYHANPVILAFMKILDLPNIRFTTEQMFSLLDLPSVASRFNFNKKELEILRHWILESGIRWGLNDDIFYTLNLPVNNKHTWKFGLNRMLLGYAMDSSQGEWQGLLPYDETNGLIANLVGYLADFLNKLSYWRDYLSKKNSIEIWIKCAHHIIEDFFLPNDNETKIALTLIENCWQNILKCGLEINYNDDIPIEILQDELFSKINKVKINQYFVSNVINFCTLMPMRAIPFKVICILGMNDNLYPKKNFPLSFDLMNQQSRCGDRSKHDDDCYLFLEALLSAQEKFYISFIGRDIQNNVVHYPSILINELCDYITYNFCLVGDELSDIKTSSEKLLKHLWQWHTRMPFSSENFIPNSFNQSFFSEWLLNENVNNLNFVQLLNNISVNELIFEDFLNFYKNPIRTWFQKRLLIFFPLKKELSENNELFSLNKLDINKINNKILDAIIYGKNIDLLYSQMNSLNILPYSTIGEFYWNKQYKEMLNLSKKIKDYFSYKRDDIEISLTIGNFKLTGILPQIQKNGILRWYPNSLSIMHGLILWIEHLVYCAIGGKGESRMFSNFNNWHFANLSQEKSRDYLLKLIIGYYYGMRKPLFLINRSSSSWLNACFNKYTKTIDWSNKCQQKAREELNITWHGNKFIYGEKNDPYLCKLIKNIDQVSINRIIKSTFDYFLTPCVYNIFNIK